MQGFHACILVEPSSHANGGMFTVVPSMRVFAASSARGGLRLRLLHTQDSPHQQFFFPPLFHFAQDQFRRLQILSRLFRKSEADAPGDGFDVQMGYWGHCQLSEGVGFLEIVRSIPSAGNRCFK